MNREKTDKFILSEPVSKVVRSIIRLLSPIQIYLYNQRINSKNDTSSFKLCVVANVPDRFAAERDVYMDVDCEVPFDLLIYTPAEWEETTAQPNSFARKILETGMVVYNG